MKRLISSAILAAASVCALAQSFDPITVKDSTFTIAAYPDGDRIPDYSYCGYMASEMPIPDLLKDESIPVIRLTPVDGDATAMIQNALDHAGTLPLRENGFRAVVLLANGIYDVNGSLLLQNSGVVLRGQGQGTVIRGCGSTRETLIRIEGDGTWKLGTPSAISCSYLPVNSTFIPLAADSGISEGDRILITRPSTGEWIESIGADMIGRHADYNLPAWKPGDFDLHFHRTVTSAGKDGITIDVPLPQSFDSRFGGGTVQTCSNPGIIENVAVENLALESEYDTAYPKDEDHRWMAISVGNARNGWVRRVTARHFVSSAVALMHGTICFTVEECKSMEPAGEIGGYRRLAFQTFGEQTLFNRCYSEEGYHDFSVGFSTAGPNAFIQCYAANAHGFSGALGGWSCGTLFDRVTVENAPIKFTNLELDLQGGGWSSANSLCWQCRAPQIHVGNPPETRNWAYGSRGQAYGNGSHAQHSIFRPEYFYLTQLAQRKGAAPQEELDKVIRYNPDFSKTDAAFAALHSRRALEPAWTIDRWIDTLAVRYPLVADAEGTVSVPQPKAAKPAAPQSHRIAVSGGRILVDGAYLAGRSSRTALWRGNPRPSEVKAAGPHLTRFVPGRSGRGLTDDLDELRTSMIEDGYASFAHYPALWYERRRDDHGRMMRADADVWAPFYEQPFARSGRGEANDRLSRYDLDRWNKWYWNRLTAFSGIAEETGIAFIHEHYLQHNIIEEGAHWVDYPWRDANNINGLGFQEPTYMQGDKRVFMAEQFYNLDNERLAAYHRKYVRKSLEAVENGSNVLHHIGAEYTGPAAFMKFWLQTIMDWEAETGRNVKVALNATKDVTDEILADPHFRDAVDVIDIRQWNYRTDGKIYAPEGGVSLAPRQYARVMDTGTTDSDCVYRAIREYRVRYPEKAVIYNATRDKGAAWIAFIAGASLCQIPSKVEAKGFYTKVLDMEALADGTVSNGSWAMGKSGTGYAVYTLEGGFDIDLGSDKASYKMVWIDPASGRSLTRPVAVKGGRALKMTAPQQECVMYLYK